MKNSKRKSEYNPDRHNYMQSDGSYVYEYWDENIHAYRKEILRPGEKGVTKEWIAELDKSDYSEDKNDEQQKQLRDEFYDTYLKLMDSAEKEPINPVEAEFYRRFMHQSEEYTENVLIELVAQLIQKLTVQQIELFYLIFGELKQYQEIADMDDTPRQAVYGKCQRIIRRIRKLLAEQGVEF